MGAGLGEIPAAAILSAGAKTPKGAARLALAAAGGGLIGRVGDPALLILAGDHPTLLAGLVPLGIACALVARPSSDDLVLAEDGNRARTVVVFLVAVAAVVLIARRFLQGQGPLTAQELAQLTGASPGHVSDCLHLLTDSGLLLQLEGGACTLARPASSIRISEVVSAWRSRTGPSTHAEGEALLRHPFQRLNDVLNDTVEQAAQSLIARDAEVPSAPIELNPRGSSPA